ncbi:MAG: hypothetical protein V4726_22225 [Verrucomicrobiota bacterium]
MNLSSPVFHRRLGPDPHEGEAETVACDGCPDFWELEDGSIAVIGIRITDQVRGTLPPTAGCGADEEVVLIPRSLILAARGDILKLR